MAGSTFSVLGPDIAITGDLKATADLHVDGRIDGDIDCAVLVQGEAGEINGNRGCGKRPRGRKDQGIDYRRNSGDPEDRAD